MALPELTQSAFDRLIGEGMTEAKFLDKYQADSPVRVGPRQIEMKLGAALAAEADYCEGDSKVVEDPARRLPYLAGMLAAGGVLLPEHSYLLDREEL